MWNFWCRKPARSIAKTYCRDGIHPVRGFLNLQYFILRVIRHFLPEGLVRFLLRRNWIIKAGLETNDPFAAVQRYTHYLAERGLSLQGKRVLIFGYGGRFDTGFALLKKGASYVVLCDKYAPPDETHNLRRFQHEAKYFLTEKAGLRPRPEWMGLLQEDIRDESLIQHLEPFDLVISNSVYEHLEDVEGITKSLVRLTKAGGLHIHYVDLRDHLFKYPFEMLCFSEETWRRWLNPSSNHNRYRIWNYRAAFESCFKHVQIDILARDEAAFRRVLPYIRPEFVSGDMAEDSVSRIRVIASNDSQT
jgi:SAM-dependent methyltransferase